MKKERTNSLASIVCSRLRSNMRPDTLENMVLSHSWLKEVLDSIGGPITDPADIAAWATSFSLALVRLL